MSLSGVFSKAIYGRASLDLGTYVNSHMSSVFVVGSNVAARSEMPKRNSYVFYHLFETAQQSDVSISVDLRHGVDRNGRHDLNVSITPIGIFGMVVVSLPLYPC